MVLQWAKANGAWSVRPGPDDHLRQGSLQPATAVVVAECGLEHIELVNLMSSSESNWVRGVDGGL